MEQKDEVSQEVMDPDPLMLESIDDFDAFMELGESTESVLSDVLEEIFVIWWLDFHELFMAVLKLHRGEIALNHVHRSIGMINTNILSY